MIPTWVAVRILRFAILNALGLVVAFVGIILNARWVYWPGLAMLVVAILYAWRTYRLALGMQRRLVVDPKRLRRAGAAGAERLGGRREQPQRSR